MSNSLVGKYKRKNKVWGRGKYSDEKYTSRINGIVTPEYTTWETMLQRCYDDKLHSRNPSYKDCEVCEEWLNYQNFAKWFEENYIEGFQLDKDILVKGNKIYSPETCCFVPQEINLAVIKPIKERNLPTGVYKHVNKFVVHIKTNKKKKYIGIFSTVEEANDYYKKAKKEQLIELANKYKTKITNNTYFALVNYN